MGILSFSFCPNFWGSPVVSIAFGPSRNDAERSLKHEFVNNVRANRRMEPHPYLPEGEVAVGIGVRGEVPAVGGESHRCYGSFMAVDSLAREADNRNVQDSLPVTTTMLNRLLTKRKRT